MYRCRTELSRLPRILKDVWEEFKTKIIKLYLFISAMFWKWFLGESTGRCHISAFYQRIVN
jgi:hypothetical protein